MAMKFFTGWAANSLANLVAGGYLDAAVGGQMFIQSATGPFGGSTLSYNSNGTSGYVQKNYGANFSTFFVGKWFRLNATTTSVDYIAFYDGATPQVYVEIGSTGQLSFFRGTPGSGTLLATSVAATLSLNKWTFIELGIVFNGSTGSVEMKFNGADVISLTGSLNTAPSGNAQFNVLRLGSVATGGLFQTLSYDIGDLYTCDNSGALNNTFLGPGQSYLNPATANDVTQFTGTPNTGSNTWENISNNPSVGTDYNFSDTATQQDTFDHSALPGTVSSILAVQVSAFWGLDAAGSRTAQVVAKSGATTSRLPASPDTISPGFSWGTGIYETDPNTSAAWTVSNYNAATFGYYLAT